MDLVIRTRAVPETGAGHGMRCASLAEAWMRAGAGPATFCGEITIPFVRQRLAEIGAKLVGQIDDARLEGSVLVCDDYDRSARQEAASGREVSMRVLVDDIGEDFPDGFDVIWNPNAYDARGLYGRFDGLVLNGAEYVPLRSDLPKWAPVAGRGAAVLYGGGRIPPSLVAATRRWGDHAPQSPAAAGAWVPANWPKVSPDRPWDTISQHEWLVTATGTTVWEAAYVGIPVVVVRFAANQSLVFEWALQQGVPGVDAVSVDDPEALERTLRNALPKARPLPAISNGALRVVEALRAQAQKR